MTTGGSRSARSDIWPLGSRRGTARTFEVRAVGENGEKLLFIVPHDDVPARHDTSLDLDARDTAVWDDLVARFPGTAVMTIWSVSDAPGWGRIIRRREG